jgi:hypothetical protein
LGQGGNVYEWEETDFDLVNDFGARGVRGGSTHSIFFPLLASTRNLGGIPSVGSEDTGFRVASIPEPSTLLLGAIASLGLLLRRRNRTG